jgi:hypothetical protein
MTVKASNDITNELDYHDRESAWNDGVVTHVHSKSPAISHVAREDYGVDDPIWRAQMVSLYFESVHDTHHSLFHRPTFERETRNGKVDDAILYAILALGAR